MTTRLTEAEVIVARRVMAMQAATRPADGNIGPSGAWARAERVSDGAGRNAHERMSGGVFRTPTPPKTRKIVTQFGIAEVSA